MPTLHVRLPDNRSYPVVIQEGALLNVGRLIRPRVRGTTAALISHPRIDRLYGKSAKRSLAAAGFKVHTFLVPEGEKTKSLKQVESLVGRFLDRGLDRTACVAALGGGVIGDLAGLVAAVYMRGMDFVQIPTTLLAQVDSSLGGKVAVNHPRGKNMIGAFYQPRIVIADPAVLQTLPDRQFRSGLAEVIKAAVIADAELFKILERRMPEILLKEPKILSLIIGRACAVKARVVERDEREAGLRAILNYGHTLGHALEAYHHYRRYLHGEAIAIGMAAASRLAREIGLCDQATADRQERLLARSGLPIQGQGEQINSLLMLMKTDKKARGGKMNFVLTPQIGHARIDFNLAPFSVLRVIRNVVNGLDSSKK